MGSSRSWQPPSLDRWQGLPGQLRISKPSKLERQAACRAPHLTCGSGYADRPPGFLAADLPFQDACSLSSSPSSPGLCAKAGPLGAKASFMWFVLGAPRSSGVSAAEKPRGCAQGYCGVGGEDGEAGPGADREVAVGWC